MNSPLKYSTCLLLGLLAMASPVLAQDNAPPQGDEPVVPQEESLTIEELQTRLQHLQKQLQSEQQAIEARQQDFEASAKELTTRRAELADELLDSELEIERLDRQIPEIASEIESAAQDVQDAQKEARDVQTAIRDAAERLSLHLSEVPGTEAAQKRLSELLESLGGEEMADGETLSALAKELGSAHADCTQLVVLDQTPIHTADGSHETVELLRLGHVRFAYRTRDGRIGLALASPHQASGYRWSEELPATVQTSLASAFDDVRGGAALTSLPVDPLGNIQPENLEPEPSLWDRFSDGGPVMVPLLIVALAALGLILERAYFLFIVNGGSAAAAKKTLEAVRAGQAEQAEGFCQRSRGAVSQILAACLRRREQGQRAMEDSIQEQLLHEIPPLQRFMGGIAILAAIAPLLGLLGTVTGIIKTFGVIKAFGNANPGLMAGGISEALLTTAAGLVIAVPILLLHSLLRGRADKIVADAERYAATLLTTLVHDVSPEALPSRKHNKARLQQPRSEKKPQHEEAIVD